MSIACSRVLTAAPTQTILAVALAAELVGVVSAEAFKALADAKPMAAIAAKISFFAIFLMLI